MLLESSSSARLTRIELRRSGLTPGAGVSGSRPDEPGSKSSKAEGRRRRRYAIHVRRHDRTAARVARHQTVETPCLRAADKSRLRRRDWLARCGDTQGLATKVALGFDFTNWSFSGDDLDRHLATVLRRGVGGARRPSRSMAHKWQFRRVRRSSARQ
jgi:hypothetical protein